MDEIDIISIKSIRDRSGVRGGGVVRVRVRTLRRPPKVATTTQTNLLPTEGVSCGPLAKGAALSSIAIHRHFILQGSRGHLSPALESVGSTFFQKRLVPKRQGGFPAAEVGVF